MHHFFRDPLSPEHHRTLSSSQSTANNVFNIFVDFLTLRTTDEKCSIWIGLIIRLGESVYADGSNPRINSSYVFLVCIPPSKRYIAQLNGDASQIFSILLTNHGKKGKHLCSKFATTEITTTTFLKPYSPLVLCIKDSHSVINVGLKQNNF